ncbi:MAG: type 4a pilus biogenesis protein PilO [Burkholderiales bacterium]
MLRRERLLLFSAVAVLALIALYLLVFSSRLTDLRLARADEARKRSEVGRLAAVVQQRTEIEQQHAAARRALEDLLDRVPRDPALPALLTQVDFALRASGLELVEITFPQQTQEAASGSTQQPSGSANQAVGSLTFQMQVRGRFPQLLVFVQMMESLPRAVVLDTLTITGSDTGTQSGLAIRAFYLR